MARVGGEKRLTVPEDKILVLDGIVSGSPLLDTLRFLALVREFAGRKQLIVLVLGHPDWASGELCTLEAERLGVGQDHLAG